MKKTIAAVSAIVALSATAASADLSERFGRATKIQTGKAEANMLPPSNYRSQWWTAPNGCEYSRAGRPGETVWYLIVNRAHRGCMPYLVQRGFRDAY
jgi:hypothetical protein